MSGVFISYRRDDSRGSAGRLYDDLSDRFGAELVFRDLDAIAPGAVYKEVIDTAIAGCTASIVVIGNSWLESRDPNGQRRIDNPKDLVRLEIAAALRQKKVLIPVLVEDATMPSEVDLPTDLAPLAMHNALPISDQRWEYDVSRLFARLDPLLEPEQPGGSVDQDGGRTALPGRFGGTRSRRRIPVIAVIVLCSFLLAASVIARSSGDKSGQETEASGSRPGAATTGSASPVPGAARGGAATIPFAIGDTVENGRPAGAGNIAVAGAKQRYTFAGTAGQVLYLKTLYEGSCCVLGWVLLGPSGERVGGLDMNADIGRVKLSANGTHTIEVAGNGDAVGTYGFTVTAVPPDATFPFAIGDTVENGKPAGAGNIAVAGAKQRYTFAGTAGQILYLKTLYEGSCCVLGWVLLGPSGDRVGAHDMNTDIGRVKLSANGTHTIEVAGNGDAVGTYGFTVTAVPPDATFPFAIGDTVENGRPAGAGNIAVAGAKQRYTFAGTAGQVLYLKTLYEGSCCVLGWVLLGPSGDRVGGLDMNADIGRVKLSANGTHTIEVAGNGDAVGTYGFTVTAVA